MLKVAGVDCLDTIEYYSERKITCLTKPGQGTPPACLPPHPCTSAHPLW